MAIRLTRFTYERLVSVERFGNVKVGATVEFDESDDPDEAFDRLRRQVDLKVLERKHRIEGTLGDDDDEGPQPRAQQFRNGIGGALLGPSGSAIANMRATIAAPPVYSPGDAITPPLGGELRVTVGGTHGDGVLELFANDRQRVQHYTVNRADALAYQSSNGEGRWVVDDQGLVAYRPADQIGWLQILTEASGAQYLEFFDYRPARAPRPLCTGFAHRALGTGLLLANRGKPGLHFAGDDERAFWEAHDDYAILAADPAAVADTIHCPDCQGEGYIAAPTNDANPKPPIVCSRCGGEGKLYECPVCTGSGDNGKEVCKACRGVGYLRLGVAAELAE